MNSEISTFVKESLAKGLKRGDIRQALAQAGWQEEEVQKALSEFAEIEFPVPVPKPKPYLQAREAFLYLISFITLYITAFSFGVLVFAFIDKLLPDPLQFHGFFPRGLTTTLASLIVAFPLYLFMMWRLARAAARDPERRQSKVAKWLTYITLVVAAGIIIGDLIAVLSNLLSGELTTRFVLKAFTILAITGSIFGYYLLSLQKEEKEGEEKPAQSPKGIEAGPRPQSPSDSFGGRAPQSPPVSDSFGRGFGGEKPTGVRIFTGVVVGTITLAVLYGLILVGTPAQQRLLQFDERRVSDLQQITFAIDAYWDRNKKLPESLEDLRDPRYYLQSIADPKTGDPYEYHALSETGYELCAAFEVDSSQIQEEFPKPFSAELWDHGVGRTCFPLEVREPIKEGPIPVPAR